VCKSSVDDEIVAACANDLIVLRAAELRRIEPRGYNSGKNEHLRIHEAQKNQHTNNVREGARVVKTLLQYLDYESY
jgi:hypothetical protein